MIGEVREMVEVVEGVRLGMRGKGWEGMRGVEVGGVERGMVGKVGEVWEGKSGRDESRGWDPRPSGGTARPVVAGRSAGDG
ncbi:hypothetical protein GCM10027063_35840 [Promicromonospora xylanilytica]